MRFAFFAFVFLGGKAYFRTDKVNVLHVGGYQVGWTTADNVVQALLVRLVVAAFAAVPVLKKRPYSATAAVTTVNGSFGSSSTGTGSSSSGSSAANKASNDSCNAATILEDKVVSIDNP